MFDIQKALARFEDELNDGDHTGFKFRIDMDDYENILGSSRVNFKVHAYYEPSNDGTPTQMVTGFYSGLSAFIDKGARGVYGASFDLSVNQKAVGPLSLEAKVNIPITHDDFGDQV